MEFKISKGKFFGLFNILYVFIVLGFVLNLEINDVRDMIDMIFVFIVPFALIYILKISRLVFNEDDFVFMQGKNEKRFSYECVTELKRIHLKRPTVLFGPERIRFIYLNNGKRRAYDIAPEDVDKCFAMLQNRIEAYDKQ